MKGASKVIMGATLVMIVSLAIVLALILVLLAELYCSLLLRRRRLLGITSSNATTTAAGTTTSPTFNASSPQPQNRRDAPHTTYYAPGVLHAPRSLFFPAVSCKRNKATEMKDQLSQIHYILDVHTQESNSSSQQLGLINTSSTKLVTSPHQIREIPIRISSSDVNEKACGGSGEPFVCISNPIYDNEASRESKVETPFETPGSSPSRLETGGSSSDEEIAHPSTSSPHSPPATPPLTPMKKLPAKACSVSLRDARSLGTSGSDIVSNNGLSSSSSSVSPCTSPSW
ncbi:mediator of RNA polymerase II transcription subunit 1 [Manihot esculenta]|uniref:Uncharacterized protein n=1 Tax=Manihot esculenta TaxID=3983 RepID=A0A2C9UAU0_MANES|nr:mediator of RNA polymerase II transcription subunit 1 [Manihot esculenta]XP_043807955.1 mediator of RNA polymerase II transcription subunit 1 [Manihot esculenta]OAY27322.1 hypothetical protein MANES_16G116600v8 [Manihot esculenta]